MLKDESMVKDAFSWVLASIFIVALAVLTTRLKEVQIDDAADYNYAKSRQSVRRVQLGGIRGRILDRNGEVLADNRRSVSIVCAAEHFQKRTWTETIAAIEGEIAKVAKVIGRPSPLSERAIKLHVNQSLAMPLVVWRDVGDVVLARFCEHESEFKGFSVMESTERVYPQGAMASHLLGYVGRERGEVEAGDEKFNFCLPEMRGRSGLEIYYDSFLRGVSGEKKLLVDARGFAISEWVVAAPRRGPDLNISLDVNIQRLVERELAGEKGACVVIDPVDGDVLAFASQPGYDPNSFVPSLNRELYHRYSTDASKPLLNRASGGAYAPGSTFKPITALAGLAAGFSEHQTYDCNGVFVLGSMRLRCASRWGHGPLDMREALCESCNPYFCHLATTVGTNHIIRAARSFALGEKTGIDLGVDIAGVVPDAEWKMSVYSERWYPGDLPQMAIGQGMLLVSPLQMARVAGAIATGHLVRPRINLEVPVSRKRLSFSESHLKVVREGMRRVVDGGTGKKGGSDLAVEVCGKTGTAEIGRGETKRKNTWFIAYAPRVSPRVALAILVEDGKSGGSTAAPKARNILAGIFGEKSSAGEVAR
jgi:penicillin-binding protein 2